MFENAEYLLFDLDGTLTDSAPGILSSVRYSLQKMKRPIPDGAVLGKFLGPPLLSSYAEHCGMTKSEALCALELYREYFTDRGMFENSLYDGITDALTKLKNSGKKLVIATSKPEPFARTIAEHFKISGYFDAIVGATMDEKRTAKKDVVGYILETLNIPESKAVMIGDRKGDIDGGHACGVKAIGVLYGYGDRDELKDADALAGSPEELCGLFLK